MLALWFCFIFAIQSVWFVCGFLVIFPQANSIECYKGRLEVVDCPDKCQMMTLSSSNHDDVIDRDCGTRRRGDQDVVCQIFSQEYASKGYNDRRCTRTLCTSARCNTPGKGGGLNIQTKH